MNYTQIRREATSSRIKLRFWFKENFDFSGGVMQHYKGASKLEGEDFDTYKDRLWVQNKIIKFV